MTTLVLADDHDVVRRGLRTLLEAEPDFEVVGEAPDGFVALDLIERLQPEVAIIDLMMPGLGGLEVVRQLRQRTPRTKAIVLSMHANESYVLEALRNGASAYVLKNASVTECVRAVREVMAGQRYLSPPLSDRAIEAYLQKTQDVAQDPYDRLTTREREVLHMAAEGHTTGDIAARLSISPRTAENHRANLMHKLGLRSQTDLLRYALRRGIIPLEE